MIIIYAIVFLFLILLVVLINLVRKKKSLGHVLRYLVPAYLLTIAATMTLKLELFLDSSPVSPAIYFAIIILLAICASVGAFLHNKKTYIFGLISAAILAVFCFLCLIGGFLAPNLRCLLIIYPVFLLVLCVLGFVCDKAVNPKSLADSNTKPQNKQALPKSSSAKTLSVHSHMEQSFPSEMIPINNSSNFYRQNQEDSQCFNNI